MACGGVRGARHASQEPQIDGCACGPHIGESLFRNGAGFRPQTRARGALEFDQSGISPPFDSFFREGRAPESPPSGIQTDHGFAVYHLPKCRPFGTRRGSSILHTKPSDHLRIFIRPPGASLRRPKSPGRHVGACAPSREFPPHVFSVFYAIKGGGANACLSLLCMSTIAHPFWAFPTTGQTRNSQARQTPISAAGYFFRRVNTLFASGGGEIARKPRPTRRNISRRNRGKGMGGHSRILVRAMRRVLFPQHLVTPRGPITKTLTPPN